MSLAMIDHVHVYQLIIYYQVRIITRVDMSYVRTARSKYYHDYDIVYVILMIGGH